VITTDSGIETETLVHETMAIDGDEAGMMT
jgi:hypothetical protein